MLIFYTFDGLKIICSIENVYYGVQNINGTEQDLNVFEISFHKWIKGLSRFGPIREVFRWSKKILHTQQINIHIYILWLVSQWIIINTSLTSYIQ